MRTWMLVGVGLVAAGCGGPKLVPVGGVVTVNGSPLAGGAVMFVPDNGDGRPGTALTDAGGRFTLVSNTDAGLAPGRYKVTVLPPGANTAPSTGAAIDSPEYAKAMAAAGNGGPTKAPSPLARYETPASTPLVVEVPIGGITDIDLRLSTD